MIHKLPVYPCSICNFKSSSKRTLKEHFKWNHSNKCQYVCHACGKKFLIKKELSRHMKDSHFDGSSRIMCNECGIVSKTLRAYKVHMSNKHYKKFACQICPRRMATQENLEHHLKWHETKEKIKCPTCSKKVHNSHIESHMRVHTGAKPFLCLVCDKAFRMPNALARHVITHTGKKPFACDVCSLAFTRKHCLIRHRNRHPGPLPPLPEVSLKSIITEFMKEYAVKNAAKKEGLKQKK